MQVTSEEQAAAAEREVAGAMARVHLARVLGLRSSLVAPLHCFARVSMPRR